MGIPELIRSLQRIDWHTDRHAMDRAAALLEHLWVAGGVQDRVADYLATLSYPDPAVTRTAELHSWKLHRTPAWDLALNQFLPYLGESRTASENIHNHTRPLASLTVAGGYGQDYFRPREHLCQYLDGQPWAGRVERYAGPRTHPGMVYVTGVDVFHALTDFTPGTMTLVVYGPLEQDCIVCFNQLSGLVERRRTATNAKNALIDTLRQTR